MATEKRWTFKCSGCTMEHAYGSYAIAQLASGYAMNFTGCSCGTTTVLTRRKMDADAERAKES